MQRLQSALRRPQNLDAPRRPLRLRRARWIAMIIAAALLISMGGTTAAWSLWSQQITLSAQVKAGTVAAPTSLTCTTQKQTILIVSTNYAQVSWPAAEAATGYAVYLRNADSTVVRPLGTTDAATRSFDIQLDLLTNVLDGILTLLLGGEHFYIYVETIRATAWHSAQTPPTDWHSEPSPSTAIMSSTLLGGGLSLGGIACVP